MEFRELIEMVKESLYCQVCGQGFDDNKVELAGYNGNALYFHAYCDKGHVPSNSLIKAVAPATPALAEFVTKLHGEPMRTDDVLDLKNYLKGFKGDFEQLFGQRY